MKNAGVNMEMVRKRNRASILKYINDNGPASRKDLAGVLGLTAAAVTQICTDLFEEGILVETGINVESQGAGRKKILLDIDYGNTCVASITIDPEYTTVAICDYHGQVLAKKRQHTESEMEPADYVRKLARRASKLLAIDEVKNSGRQLTAIGVGITGIVDKESGSSTHAYGIWQEPVPVAAILAEAFSVPVYVENNVNAFAMAELFYGTGKVHDNLMVIKWGPGVGCAMIIDQDIYEGRHAKAAELGHFIVEKNGLLCSCGRRGCLETKVSYSALSKIVEFEEDDLGGAYEASRGSEAGEKLDEAIDIFARSIVNSATIMAPNRIVLTGSLFASPQVRSAFIAACSSYDPGFNENRIIYSDLAKKASYIGPVAICAKMQLFS